jgi:hypothetical protein
VFLRVSESTIPADSGTESVHIQSVHASLLPQPLYLANASSIRRRAERKPSGAPVAERAVMIISQFLYISPTPLTLRAFALKRRMASKESSFSLRSLTQCPTTPYAYHAQILAGTLIRTHTIACHFEHNPILSSQHMLLYDDKGPTKTGTRARGAVSTCMVDHPSRP